MSSVEATVKNGEIVTSASQDSLSKKTNDKSGSQHDDARYRFCIKFHDHHLLPKTNAAISNSLYRLTDSLDPVFTGIAVKLHGSSVV